MISTTFHPRLNQGARSFFIYFFCFWLISKFYSCSWYDACAQGHASRRSLIRSQVFQLSMSVSLITSGVNLSVRILEVSYQLKAVGEQTTDLLRITEHVCRNLNEARRLRRRKSSWINVGDGAWMDEQIEDCEKALQEVQQLIEPARVATTTTESIDAKTRVLWVFRDCPKVAYKRDRLSACHQTLNNIINILQTRNLVATPLPPTDIYRGEPPPYTKDMEVVFNWRDRMRSTKGTTTRKSNDGLTPSTCSMSAPSTPVPACPDATQSCSVEGGQRPPLVSCLSEPSIKVAPPPPYHGYNDLDRLSSFGSTGNRQLASDVWSPVYPPPSTEDSATAHSMNFSHNNRYCIPPKPFEDYRQTPDQGYSTTAGLKTTPGGAAEAAQSFPRLRGRDWLASYAATSDIRYGYGGSRNSG